MAEINVKRLTAIRESAANRKKRKRSANLHITVTDAEREEFRCLAEEAGMLDREFVMASARAFKSLAKRVETTEARLVLLANRMDILERTNSTD